MARQTTPLPFPVSVDLTGVGYCVAFNFRKTARSLTRAYDAALRPSGLRTTQFSILVGVAKSQPISIGELAGVLLIDPSTLSRSLRVIEREGLVVISGRCAMRQRFVTLSRQGAQALDRSLVQWRQMQNCFLDYIGLGYWKKLQRDFETLSRHALAWEKTTLRTIQDPNV